MLLKEVCCLEVRNISWSNIRADREVGRCQKIFFLCKSKLSLFIINEFFVNLEVF